MVVRVATVAFQGIEARPVDVQVQISNGEVRFSVVGLGDKAVTESRERVRSALTASGLALPARRITVNLAPADMPKEGSHYDLPIALGILAASGLIDGQRLARFEFAGELSLSGSLRPVRGALAMALALHTAQVQTSLVLPPGSAEEAALVPGSRVYRAAHLLDVVRQFLPGVPQEGPPDADEGWTRLQTNAPAVAAGGPDLADVKGHPHSLAENAQFAIADAVDNHRISPGPGCRCEKT